MKENFFKQWRELLAFAFGELGQVGAVVELALEELHSNDGENEIEQHVDDENVEDVLERVDHAVEDRFELGHPVDGLERTQHAQHTQRFDRVQVLASTIALALQSYMKRNYAKCLQLIKPRSRAETYSKAKATRAQMTTRASKMFQMSRQ